jgi:hypothetical protein
MINKEWAPLWSVLVWGQLVVGCVHSPPPVAIGGSGPRVNCRDPHCAQPAPPNMPVHGPANIRPAREGNPDLVAVALAATEWMEKDEPEANMLLVYVPEEGMSAEEGTSVMHVTAAVAELTPLWSVYDVARPPCFQTPCPQSITIDGILYLRHIVIAGDSAWAIGNAILGPAPTRPTSAFDRDRTTAVGSTTYAWLDVPPTAFQCLTLVRKKAAWDVVGKQCKPVNGGARSREPPVLSQHGANVPLIDRDTPARR